MKNPAMIAIVLMAVVWLIVVVAIVTSHDAHPDEPAGLPTVSYTDCWPDAPK